MSKIVIWNGDALDLFKKVKTESIDLVVTDPPYNIGKDYGECKDSMQHEEFIDFSKKWLKEAHRVLKPTGTMYIFMGYQYIAYLYIILERRLKMKFKNWICWNYTQGIGKRKGFSNRHDSILVFDKSINSTFNLNDIRIPQKNSNNTNNMRGANPGDVWEFSHIHSSNKNRKPHPTQKPEGVIERIVLASSNKYDKVLDPFAGSGTTLRVCQQLDRNCLGFELNPTYVEIIKSRLDESFTSFDTIDAKMKRIPVGLSDPDTRIQYLKNHEKWFLSGNTKAIEEFRKEVKKQYGSINF